MIQQQHTNPVSTFQVLWPNLEPSVSAAKILQASRLEDFLDLEQYHVHAEIVQDGKPKMVTRFFTLQRQPNGEPVVSVYTPEQWASHLVEMLHARAAALLARDYTITREGVSITDVLYLEQVQGCYDVYSVDWVDPQGAQRKDVVVWATHPDSFLFSWSLPFYVYQNWVRADPQ